MDRDRLQAAHDQEPAASRPVVPLPAPAAHRPPVPEIRPKPVEPRLPGVAPRDLIPEVVAKEHPLSPRLRQWGWIVGASVVCTAAVLWMITTPVFTTVVRVEERVADALSPMFGEVLDWLGVHTSTKPPTTKPVAPSDTSAAPSMVAAARRAAAAPPRPRADAPVRGVSQPVAAPPVTSQAAQAPVLSAADPPSIDRSIVYSPDDADVVPPMAIDQDLRTSAPAGGADGAAAISILVDESGHVESAVLVRRPATLQAAMQATMTLSSAKTWRFHPAMKAGQPVKYRRTIWVVNQ